MLNLEDIKFKRIVIVAYRLPFKLLNRKGNINKVQNSGGLVSAILSLSQRIKPSQNENVKILWAGAGEKDLQEDNNHQIFELLPVNIPKHVNDKYYGGFCNDMIWPLFHYFPANAVYDNNYYEAYQTANEIFMDELRQIIRPGDFIWIHDYQLLLLPEMIRKAYPEASVGFFLHIPFPSYEIFRLMPRKWREAILNGMTGADVVGFHTNDYAQNFFKSVKRTLGYKVERNMISIEDRLCKADAFPIGIDYNKFNDACSLEKTITIKNKYKKHIAGCKLIFSIDRLDYSKGFIQRLTAFNRFLEKYPEWRHKVVFNMIVVPSRDNIQVYKEMKKEIEASVGRINGQYSTLKWRPIVYQYRSVNFNELTAIYNLSDVGLITPLRDGMNLVAKEYVACQTEKYGMLVLSEFAGASVELNESILINPADTEETADAINEALYMSDDEKKKRILKMQERIKRYNVFSWATDFFNQINEIKKEQISMQVKYIDKDTLRSIYSSYSESSRRLCFFDYDGTLTPLAKTPEMAVLDRGTREILDLISIDGRNEIVIISGRNKEFLAEQFEGLDALLVAEHGYFVKYPESDWTKNIEIDLSWKEKILPVLSDYVDRCNGSAIEEKEASLVWHYRNAEEDTALLRINELKDDLSGILVNEPKLTVLEGDKVIEIKSILYDKGTIASALVNMWNYDFILAIGDDNTDEDLFRVVPEKGFTIKVGSKPSVARFNVKNQSQVLDILRILTSSSAERVE
jgi:trehalose 6-phosphate synthase/phosphatase